jgi:isochorismate pyruvate lyase
LSLRLRPNAPVNTPRPLRHGATVDIALVMTVPDPNRRNTSDTCSSMTDVRYEIDRLDRVLVALLAERQGFMDAAARIKGSRGAVRDEDRINDVLDKVRATASAEGLSHAIAEPVWRVLMERCIAYEFASFDTRRAAVQDLSDANAN